MMKQPGCYRHHHSGLKVSQPFTSVQMQHLQPLLLWEHSLKHKVPPTPDPSNDTWLQAWLQAAQACFCDRPHVIAAAIAAATD